MLQYARELIATIMQKDPAAHSRWEVVLAYPGFHAVMIHRLSLVLDTGLEDGCACRLARGPLSDRH